jgi:hypothetical protein
MSQLRRVSLLWIQRGIRVNREQRKKVWLVMFGEVELPLSSRKNGCECKVSSSMSQRGGSCHGGVYVILLHHRIVPWRGPRT